MSSRDMKVCDTGILLCVVWVLYLDMNVCYTGI